MSVHIKILDASARTNTQCLVWGDPVVVEIPHNCPREGERTACVDRGENGPDICPSFGGLKPARNSVEMGSTVPGLCTELA